MLKKLLIVLVCVLGICGCSTTRDEVKSILNKEKINLEIYYHRFDQKSDNNHNLWLVAYVIYFDDKNMNLNKVTVDIDGIQKYGIVNKKIKSKF